MSETCNHIERRKFLGALILVGVTVGACGSSSHLAYSTPATTAPAPTTTAAPVPTTAPSPDSQFLITVHQDPSLASGRADSSAITLGHSLCTFMDSDEALDRATGVPDDGVVTQAILDQMKSVNPDVSEATVTHVAQAAVAVYCPQYAQQAQQAQGG